MTGSKKKAAPKTVEDEVPSAEVNTDAPRQGPVGEIIPVTEAEIIAANED